MEGRLEYQLMSCIEAGLLKSFYKSQGINIVDTAQVKK